MLFKLVTVFELLDRSRTSYYILHLILHFGIIDLIDYLLLACLLWITLLLYLRHVVERFRYLSYLY